MTRHLLLTLFGIGLLASSILAGPTQEAVDDSLDLGQRMLPVPRSACFQDPGYFTWCGSMIQGDDEKYYLCYSRWPYEKKMSGWVTYSEVALAVADHPLGPYRHHSVLLHGRGKGHFDGTMIHNPHVHKFGDKFYLYYVGASDAGSFRATRLTQRIGVAVADSILGPWQRFDQPLIDVTPDSFDAALTTNPSVTYFKGRYIMVYKCQGKDGKVFHGVAFSDSPTGPFVKHSRPIFTDPRSPFPAEDPFLFTYKGKLYTILSDNKVFTDIKQALCLFESEDGVDWKLSKHAIISDRTIQWADGSTEKLGDLERPQIFFDRNGEPAVLFCAATHGKRAPGNTFNIQIPLNPTLLKP